MFARGRLGEYLNGRGGAEEPMWISDAGGGGAGVTSYVATESLIHLRYPGSPSATGSAMISGVS
jgi:hypothetical protein